jgi:hypothetical protein
MMTCRRREAAKLRDEEAEHEQQGDRQNHQQRLKRFLLRFVLAADFVGVSDRQPLGCEHAFDVGDDAAHVAVLEPAGNRHHLLEIFAIQLCGAFDRHDLRRR